MSSKGDTDVGLRLEGYQIITLIQCCIVASCKQNLQKSQFSHL